MPISLEGYANRIERRVDSQKSWLVLFPLSRRIDLPSSLVSSSFKESQIL
jgi:hypothetical protein